MAPSDDIAQLVSRVALGERSAFRQLYELTSAKLFGVCLRILNDRDEAQDVLQEVYVKIWNKADRFATGKASAIAWLAAIARNQAIDRLRSRKPPADDITERHDLPDAGPTPEANAVASDENRRLRECLDELDPRHATAVMRTYLGGWSYQDAASELNVPLNTVKTWIRRSLLALRDCVSQ